MPIFYEKGIIISSIISELFIILILVRRKESQKINFKIVDLKINEIIFDTTFMIFIILFIDNVGGFFKVNNKILFIIIELPQMHIIINVCDDGYDASGELFINIGL